MADPNRPWDPAGQNPEPPRPRFPVGAWIGLVAVAAAGVWGLSKLFPGRLSTSEDIGDLLRAMLIVALGAAMLVGVRRDLRRSVRHQIGRASCRERV